MPIRVPRDRTHVGGSEGLDQGLHLEERCKRELRAVVIVRFKIGQNERRIKEMSAKSIANEREELVDEPRFRPTRQRSRMQHRPDALPPEPLCKLPSLVFPDVYLEQLLRPTVAWERVEQRRQERMRGHTQSDSRATHAKTLRFPSSLCRWKGKLQTETHMENHQPIRCMQIWGSCALPGSRKKHTRYT